MPRWGWTRRVVVVIAWAMLAGARYQKAGRGHKEVMGMMKIGIMMVQCCRVGSRVAMRAVFMDARVI